MSGVRWEGKKEGSEILLDGHDTKNFGSGLFGGTLKNSKASRNEMDHHAGLRNSTTRINTGNGGSQIRHSKKGRQIASFFCGD